MPSPVFLALGCSIPRDVMQGERRKTSPEWLRLFRPLELPMLRCTSRLLTSAFPVHQLFSRSPGKTCYLPWGSRVPYGLAGPLPNVMANGSYEKSNGNHHGIVVMRGYRATRPTDLFRFRLTIRTCGCAPRPGSIRAALSLCSWFAARCGTRSSPRRDQPGSRDYS